MGKTTCTLIAAFAALTLSGGAYAQAPGGTSGGGMSGSTANPSNQMGGATGGYGTPGAANSDSGMAAGAQNPGMSNNMTSTSTTGTYSPANNTLATPSVKSPAAGQ